MCRGNLGKIQNEKIREETVKTSPVGKESGEGKELGYGNSGLSNGFHSSILAMEIYLSVPSTPVPGPGAHRGQVFKVSLLVSLLVRVREGNEV